MTTTPLTTTAIKPYSTKELSELYGICVKTFLKWIKPFANSIGDKHGRYYTIAQVHMIFDKLGMP
jgi:hypothetical protein